MPDHASMPWLSCRSCGGRVLWARLNTGRWVPLDPDPHERGQMILLDGRRCHPAEPGARYGADVQARRHRSHATTCGLAPTVRRVSAVAGEVTAEAAEGRRRVRQVRLAMRNGRLSA